MQYRRWGRTNLELSIFSLGTMRCLASMQTMEETVLAAYQAGINHFETAQGYGDSEKFLGASLGRLGLRSRVFVTTKITPKPDKASMAKAIEQSYQNLEQYPIDCLALHGLNTPEHLDWVLNPNGCMAAVREACADGKVRFVGFSTHGPLDVILRAIESDQFDFINLHYNFFFQRNEDAINAASARDMGIFIISPADKAGQLYRPSLKLMQLCQPYSPLHWSYRFLLQNPRITTLSLGAANPQELQWPLEVADEAQAFSEQEKEIHNRLQQTAQRELSTEHCHQCYACLPCPEDINIPEILRLRNLTKAFDMEGFAKYRYQMFERAGHWFPGQLGSRCTECGDCLPRCPHNLSISDLILETHERLHAPSRPRLWEDRP